ncbi:unnamed protein product [Arctogadus glacialis]
MSVLLKSGIPIQQTREVVIRCLINHLGEDASALFKDFEDAADGSASVQEELAEEQLPVRVRAALANSDTTDFRALVREADRFFAAGRERCTAVLAHTTVDLEMTDTISVAAATRRQPQQSAGLCYFHALLSEANSRNLQWAYANGTNMEEKIDGMELMFEDWHAIRMLFQIHYKVKSAKDHGTLCANMTKLRQSNYKLPKRTDKEAGKGKHDTRGAKQKQADKEMTDSDSESSSTSCPIDATNLAAQITRQVATMMEEKMLAFSQKLDVITSKFEQNSERITEAENRISRAEDIIVELETKLSDAEGKIDALTHRVDDQEARSRRDNIRIFGVKEGTEGIDALSFFETWLPKVLNLETKKGRIRLDRMQFPATLRFSINKKEYSFNTADEARRVVETITLVP